MAETDETKINTQETDKTAKTTLKIGDTVVVKKWIAYGTKNGKLEAGTDRGSGIANVIKIDGNKLTLVGNSASFDIDVSNVEKTK